LTDTLRGLGREVELYLYPESQHAFFNEDRPSVFDQASASLLWDRSVDFLRSTLS